MATPLELIDLVCSRFAGQADAIADAKDPRVHVNVESWPAVARFLREDPALSLDWLRCLSGIDYAADGKLAVRYDLWSTDHRHDLAVKVYVPRDNPAVPSVTGLWRTADWHEREAFDLLGIVFTGHPNLTRILLADDWEGHPLRKDYVFPRDYHGIPGSVELDWKQH